MKAVIVKERGIAAVADVDVPALRPDRIKVKTTAVAVNPTDFHHLAGEGVGRVGAVMGCDLAGIVEEVGADCTSEVKKGDAVYGVSHCANLSSTEEGAFAEYVMVKDGHVGKKPASLSFADVATLGVGITSVGQVLYQTFGLPLPGEVQDSNPTILIYGGSSATGTLAIQFAKLSGATVITTASKDTMDLVKSRGPDLVVDYKSPQFVDDITEFVATLKEPIRYVFDCVSNESSYSLIAKTLPDKDADKVRLCALLPLDKWSRKEVQATTILAYTTFGEPFSKFGIDFPAIPQHYEFGKKFWKLAEGLLLTGKVKPHPAKLSQGGFQGVPIGIMEMSKGTVRGEKLVYLTADTGEAGGAAPNLEAVKGVDLGKW